MIFDNISKARDNILNLLVDDNIEIVDYYQGKIDKEKNKNRKMFLDTIGL